MGGWWKAKLEIGKRMEGGRQDIAVRPNRVSNIKLVARFVVSPFGVYPSQHNDWF